jgi:Raf kinase inhibitor-like YbhB/YbcL family protein
MTRTRPPDPYEFLPPVPRFDVTSEDVADGVLMDKRFAHRSAGGQNASPHLRWSGFPSQTRSFAITCFDPDAPAVSGFWHWLLVGLPETTVELGRNGVVADAWSARNDYGEQGYGGPAPPPGDGEHRYLFVVHALGTADMGLDAAASAAFVSFHLTTHALARARVSPTFAS